ncbi:MFS transporter [Actinoplanes sp. NPDC051475]|uniref:MFS transporter n=1 Tax=Actinoplanes sp. NPDC051475 TaxID=3157225 RepID=UPI00344F6A5C
MLGLATLGFAVNFWAWALLSPLAPKLKDALRLTPFQQALLVAVPVVVGSVGRIPVGALTDRFGGRIMFPLVSLATIVPVLYLGWAGHASFAGLLVGGFLLGVGGTTFAIGVPFVTAWFPSAKRGLAVGVFGMGMGGTAISALTTVKLVAVYGTATPFLVTAGVLFGYAGLAALLLRDAPNRQVPAEPLARRLAATLRLPITWHASALYAVVFGGYVAFSVYLPAYLKTAYALSQADAANRMAGFVLLAVIMRPAGGWLSDRFGPTRVLYVVLPVVGLGAVVQAFTPALAPIGTAAFLAMAAALGAGSGATFALVALLAPANKVGSVTGVVGAAGGLGGFVPPLLMGAVYTRYGSYAIGLLLLAVVAAAALVLTVTAVRKSARPATIRPGRVPSDV